VRCGEGLYEPSHPDVPLFIALDDTVSITRASGDDRILAVREAGHFTGEMSVVSGNRSFLTARVANDGTVLELTREKVLSLMANDTEIGDTLMGAFVARRMLMIQLGEGSVVLFDTKTSASTPALREFLTRNGHPFTYVDIDIDCSAELIDKLAVRNSEIPVVYCNSRYVLRNPSIADLAACLDLNISVDKRSA
jgi:thioredoxin reductase (NADPH)